MTEAQRQAIQSKLIAEFEGTTAEAAIVFLGVGLHALQLAHGAAFAPPYLRGVADQLEHKSPNQDAATRRAALRLVTAREDTP